jgi:hypothetical protein
MPPTRMRATGTCMRTDPHALQWAARRKLAHTLRLALPRAGETGAAPELFNENRESKRAARLWRGPRTRQGGTDSCHTTGPERLTMRRHTQQHSQKTRPTHRAAPAPDKEHRQRARRACHTDPRRPPSAARTSKRGCGVARTLRFVPQGLPGLPCGLSVRGAQEAMLEAMPDTAAAARMLPSLPSRAAAARCSPPPPSVPRDPP